MSEEPEVVEGGALKATVTESLWTKEPDEKHCCQRLKGIQTFQKHLNSILNIPRVTWNDLKMKRIL
jgi:hypothetical protein